ncbi:iron-siderophore ABC transporter substrate-binding protein [soil metagenome]
MTRLSPRNRPRILAVAAAALAVAMLATGCARDTLPAESSAAAKSYTVKHQYGSTTIPTDYSRVVVTFTALMDSAVAVGVVPVASPQSFEGFPAYLDVDGSDVASLGDSDADIDIEAIGAQDPDLILVNVERGAAVADTQYEALSKIAPTVPIITGEQDPRGVAKQVAVALDRVAEMKEVAADYDAHAATVKKALAKIPEAALSVSQVRLRPDHVRMMMQDTNAGIAMVDLGLNFKDPLPGAVLDGGYYETSLELLPEAIGDTVFVYSTDEGVLENVKTLPVWQLLPAVKKDRVFDVDFEAWMRGQGYLALGAVVDEIAAAYGVDS